MLNNNRSMFSSDWKPPQASPFVKYIVEMLAAVALIIEYKGGITLKQKQLGKMIAVVGIAVILCALVVINGVGQWKTEYWERIPLEMKTQIIASDFYGAQVLSVMFFPVTKKAFDLFTSGNEEITPPSKPWLIVALLPYENQFWYPSNITFTQGTTEYEVDSDGYSNLDEENEAFSGGLVRTGTPTVGFVRLPQGLDATLPFTVWIGKGSAVLKESSGIIEAFYGNNEQGKIVPKKKDRL